MVQLRRRLISSFHQTTGGTLTTPLLLFYLKLELVCKKIHRFAQHVPKMCFNTFVQSAVKTRRRGDENSNSNFVAETMKLLAKSSCVYQKIGRSRQTVAKYLNDEKTHSAKNSKMLKPLSHNTDQLYEVELVKPKIKHKQPIVVGFFILQYAKQRLLEIC